MSWVSGTAVFIMVWWVVIFMVLPWGVKRDAATGQIGAPDKAQIGRKMIITTIITIIIWLGINFIVSSPYFSFRDQAAAVPL